MKVKTHYDRAFMASFDLAEQELADLSGMILAGWWSKPERTDLKTELC